MKLRHLSYRLIFPLLAAVSLVTFWRINKVSFFHHFIKVIAEVEERNSHEISSDSKLAILTFEASRHETVQPPWLAPQTPFVDGSTREAPQPTRLHIGDFAADLQAPHPIRGP